MGLLPGDLEKVPKGIALRECYERIYKWHKMYGKKIIKVKYAKNNAYSRSYSKLVDHLPKPDRATRADMAFIFGEVIYMLMEWAYHEEDEHGIKTASYAHYALNQWFGGSFDMMREEAKASKLFESFSYDKWKRQE